MTLRSSLSFRAARALAVLREEGLAPLVRRSLAFAVSGFAVDWTLYLYEHSLVERDRSRCLPRLDAWELRVLHSNAEADAVAAEGFEDFRRAVRHSRRRLDAGAVAFCVYGGAELAHVGWLAVDQRGKDAFDRIPYRVAFASGQGCTGGTYTVPKFRGRRLMAYGYYERLEYLRTRGFTSSRNVVGVMNVASHKAHAVFNPTIYGVGHYRRFLRWQSWREEPLPGGPCRGMPPSEGVRRPGRLGGGEP